MSNQFNRTAILTLIVFSSMFTLANTDILIVRLTCVANGYYDETAIRYTPGATDYFDSSWDAWKWFSPSPNVPHIYTKDADMNDLAINSFNELVRDTVTDVYSKIILAGDYEMSVVNHNLSPGVKAYMEDLETGIVYPLDASTTFTANMVLGTEYVRFRVFFSTPLVIVGTDPGCGGSDGQLVVSDLGNDNFSYEVYDSGMNLVAQNSNANNTDVISGLVADTYTVIATTNFGDIENEVTTLTPTASTVFAEFSVSPIAYMSSGAEVNPVNSSSGAVTYTWDFGDGQTSSDENPVHQYTTPGTYSVTLVAENGACTDVTTEVVEVVNDLATGITDVSASDVTIYASGTTLNVQAELAGETTVHVVNLGGQEVYQNTYNTNYINEQVQLDLPKGVYVAIVTNNGNNFTQKIILSER